MSPTPLVYIGSDAFKDDNGDDDDHFCEPEIVYLGSDALEEQRTLYIHLVKMSVRWDQ